jgi:hypothetical protein
MLIEAFVTKCEARGQAFKHLGVIRLASTPEGNNLRFFASLRMTAVM